MDFSNQQSGIPSKNRGSLVVAREFQVGDGRKQEILGEMNIHFPPILV